MFFRKIYFYLLKINILAHKNHYIEKISFFFHTDFQRITLKYYLF